MNRRHLHLALLVSYLVIVAASAIKPRDWLVWPLEQAPVLIAAAVMVWAYKRFAFTTLTYLVFWVSAVLVAIGAHYTYEEMPLFNWLRDALDLSRNHYDRLGHLAKGVCVALLARELLVRTSGIRYGFWLPFASACITQAVAALYELVEFAAALVLKKNSADFLGTQGDVWDAQWDMLCALIGALLALALFSRLHDRQINKQTDWNTPASRK